MIVSVAYLSAIKRWHRCRTAPHLPIQTKPLGRIVAGAYAHSRRTLVHDVEGSHRSNGSEVAGLYVFNHATVILARMNLGAHLADPVMPFHRVAHSEALRQM